MKNLRGGATPPTAATTAPAKVNGPVYAKRPSASPYLQPGQHLKVASKKPPVRAGRGGIYDDSKTSGRPPVDPWLDRDSSGADGDIAAPPPPSSSSSSPPPPSRSTTTDGHQLDYHESSDAEEEFYVVSNAAPPPAAERASNLLALKHQELAEKQLVTLRQQGIARRPKSLIRTRYGQLKTIDAYASASDETEARQITAKSAPEAPLPPSAASSNSTGATERRVKKKKAPQSTYTMAAQSVAVDTASPPCDDLVFSPPLSPLSREGEKLEIDLD